ncbi:MAG: hypothetical protein ACRDGU_01480 [Actinomycetota bacterium]
MRDSGARDQNTQVEEWEATRFPQDNLPFFVDALRGLEERRFGNEGLAVMGFLGQRDIPGVTLRQAQAILRWDRRPSLWSHVFLIREPANLADIGTTPILEVPMYPRTGVFPRPERNAVSEGTLAQYRNPSIDANVALVSVSMTDEQARAVRDRALEYNVDRLRYDLWDTLGVWQAFLWSSGQAPNPLRAGFPIASSAYVEMAFEAIGLDLTPGASERNSSPEHIWTAAKWWHHAFAEAEQRGLAGFYVLRDKGCALLDADVGGSEEQPPPSSADARDAEGGP